MKKEEKGKIIEETTEIITLLNEIALLEFKHNYNLGEIQRAVDINGFGKNEQLKFYKEKLKEILPKQDNLQYTISDTGMLAVYDKIDEIQCRASQFIFHKLEIPYAYVMGSKIGKRSAQNTIEYLEHSFSRYKG